MPAAEAHEPWTISRLLAWTTDFLAKNNVDEPRLAAEVLLAAAIPSRRIDLYARHAATPDDATLTKFRDWVRRAVRHEPIAYLVGEKEFFSLRFAVTPAVLIPRPETETLVEWAIDHCRQSGLETPAILDVGTGSGCIPIALLVNLAGATAVATDISPVALEVASQNAERHKVTEGIALIEASGLSLPPEFIPLSSQPRQDEAGGRPAQAAAIAAGGFDLIVSNPPYIAVQVMPALPPNVRDFEPRSALTDEADGLTLYREIGERAANFLKPSGRILLEVADNRAAAAREAVTAAGKLTFIGSRKDRTTGADRALMFKRADIG
jgi:release factor glutamine methyltransferase